MVNGNRLPLTCSTPANRHRPTPFLGNCDPTGASSAHEAIVVGPADGSVRMLNPSMSGETWWAALTPAGSEVLGGDWLR
jgi:hypothetical protein